MADIRLQQRILSRVSVTDSGCWAWNGARRPNGYGNINVEGKTLSVHRASWIAFNGEIPDGLQVCHRCDVRHCTNPSHLFLGTQKDNMIDMISKGRQVLYDRSGESNPMFGKTHTDRAKELQSNAKAGLYAGSKHPRSTITEDVARAIKAAQGRMTARAASQAFNASFHVVRNIWAGKSWGSV